MEPFFKTLDIFRFSLFVFLFVVAGAASQAIFQNLPSGRSQAAGVALAPPEADPVARADALLAFLDDLRREINAINAAQQQAGQQGQILIFDPDSPDSVALRFNLNDAGSLLRGSQTRDKVLIVRNKTSQPVSFASLEGLGGAFSFKKGSFPGEGGTCGTVIVSGDCTLALTFEPSKGEGVPWTGSLRYRTDPASPAQLVYRVGQKTLRSNALVLVGYGVSPAAVSVLVNNPPPTRFGKESQVAIDLFSTISGSTVKTSDFTFDGVKISGVRPPFFVQENNCGGTVPISECRIVLSYRPQSVGADELDAVLAWNDGARQQNRTVRLKAEAEPPDKFVSHVLIVYNQSDPESVELKNYYLANRPGFSNANVLGVQYVPATSCNQEAVCLSGETAYKYWYKDAIANPIGVWMASRPDADIRYIVLMRGLPTSLFNPSDEEDGMKGSVQHSLFLRFNALATSLDMGSVEATEKYIDKIRTMHDAMKHPDVLVSAQDAGRAGDSYYLDDNQNRHIAFNALQAHIVYDPDTKQNQHTAVYGDFITRFAKRVFDDPALRRNPATKVFYRSPDEPPFAEAADVAGYLTWGYWGKWNGNYPVDGSIKFTGRSGWYLINTVESYNGQWTAGDASGKNAQGNFIKWFSKNAFGGSHYEYTPVGAVTTVREPYVDGKNTKEFFTCWEKGEPFAVCAWGSKLTSYFLAVGDPLVTK